MFEAMGKERNLTVIGRSPEGMTHDLRRRRQTTVYDISDPAMVKVCDEAALSRKLWRGDITVRNGAFFFEAPVIVRGETKARRP